MVIGGGIHGLTTAIALAEEGVNVILLEKKPGLFQGTSGSTHNRAHMGYHYPRSTETAIECLKGLDYFKNKYPQALIWPKEGYYVIAKEDSNTTKEGYIAACKEMGIPCTMKWPSPDLLSKDAISSSFLVPEPIFDTELLCNLLEKEALEKNVSIKKGSEVVQSERKPNGAYKVTAQEGNKKTDYIADIVINSTYAYANNILKIFGLEKYMTKYRLQVTEVVVVESDINIPPLTIMDGPFMSIMPYGGHKNQFLVYDVVNSTADEKEAYLYDDSIIHRSNWEKMVEKGKKFFPFMHKLKYAGSLWGARPIPIDNKVQSRKTRLKKYESSPGFYSILEGKFISAPLIANELKDLIKNDELLNNNSLK
jgi:glycine/D-amino acid oxidase-like deaminating enzyme